jgi:epidermal growth factor receptor substrate 15
MSDTHNRGSLDVADFIVAMYLIQGLMSGQLTFIPTSIPPGLYEMASGKGLPGSRVTSHATGNSGSFSPGLPTTFPQNSGPGIVQPQMTGRPIQPQYSGQLPQQQFTGQLSQHQTGSKPGLTRNTFASPPFAANSVGQSQLAWDITPTEKASADKYFDTLDTHRRGYIEADVAVPFMLQSKLPEDVLALVW